MDLKLHKRRPSHSKTKCFVLFTALASLDRSILAVRVLYRLVFIHIPGRKDLFKVAGYILGRLHSLDYLAFSKAGFIIESRRKLVIFVV
jgi:hypothetical protein